jgi:hypothetical protein
MTTCTEEGQTGCVHVVGEVLKQHPKYVLIYTEAHYSGGGIDPCMAQGACWTETHAEFFSDVKSAQGRMNKPSYISYSGANSGIIIGGFITQNHEPDITPEHFVGLYAITEIPVSQVKVGTEEKPVTVTQKVDKLEWRVKQ